MNKEAIFEYKYFDRYFTESDRDAFIIRENETNKIMGFVMINTYMQKFDNGHSIAKFMIIPTYRRKHIGQNVANKCFDMYKGNWEVSPSVGSKQAYSFWNKVINEYTNGNVKYENRIFMFNNNEDWKLIKGYYPTFKEIEELFENNGFDKIWENIMEE